MIKREDLVNPGGIDGEEFVTDHASPLNRRPEEAIQVRTRLQQALQVAADVSRTVPTPLSDSGGQALRAEAEEDAPRSSAPEAAFAAPVRPAETAQQTPSQQTTSPPTRSEDTGQILIDLTDRDAQADAASQESVLSLTIDQTGEWATSSEGWIRDVHGRIEWRPIMTSAPSLDMWQVETQVGLITVDVLIEGRLNMEALAAARRDAASELRSETVRRGAHGVVDVAHRVTQLDAGLLLTVTGNAVTLRFRD